MTLLQSKRRNLTKKKQFSLLWKVVSLLFVIIVISFFLYYINIMIKQNEISISTTTTTFSPLNFENHHGNITTKTKYQQEAVIKSSVLEPSSLRIVATPPPTTPPTMMKVAFAITITKDGKFQDGAAVLAYSIIESFKNDPIDISFVAFVHPNVTTSRPYLRQIGFSVIEAPTPINVSAIKGKFLREHINDKAGCCGAAELIKLYSYRFAPDLLIVNKLHRLTDFDWVVHLDADVIITKVSLTPYPPL